MISLDVSKIRIPINRLQLGHTLRNLVFVSAKNLIIARIKGFFSKPSFVINVSYVLPIDHLFLHSAYVSDLVILIVN